MSRPRVFISSTYYDLKHIRNGLEEFIDGMGYESVLFESGDIPFQHDAALTESCYEEVEKCHMLVLIIGGRYGSKAEANADAEPKSDLEAMYEKFNSVTKKEYEKARDRGIPLFIFVEKGVRSEYETYKNNRNNESITYAHVDSVNVFRLLDDILKQPANNFVREFDKFTDIANWLRDQWSGLFADFLSRKNSEIALKDLSSQVTQLSEVTAAMKHYTETIMKKLEPEQFNEIIKEQERLQTTKRVARFRNEPLIRYLRDNAKITPQKLYQCFQKANDVEEMLQLAGVDPAYIQEFLLQHRKPATDDFESLKKRYDGRDPDLLANDE